MLIKQPLQRIIIPIFLLSLVLFGTHGHYHSEADVEEHCMLCVLINTGFILTAAFCLELCYFILGILGFIDATSSVNQRYLRYLMRGPPVHPTGSLSNKGGLR